jgi:ABC-type uncharacterized transport system involved in gliding motility auxiliary subunit
MEPSLLSVGVLAVLALAVMANYLGWKYHQRFDWTRDDLYTLSEKSLNVAKALDRDIEALVFMSPAEPLFGPTQELLARYAAASERFTTRTVDPAKNILEAQQLVDRYDLTQTNVVVFDRGDDRRVIEAVDLADYDYSGLQFGGGPEMTSFKGEQAFTGALVELIEDRKRKVVFTIGHGERQLDEFAGRGLSELASLLRQDNFEIEEWSSLGDPSAPADAALVVIAGPTANFIDPEVEALTAYLEQGGRLLALLDPLLGANGELAPSGLETLLLEHGVEVGRDIVVDPANPIPFYGAETIFVNSYGTHPVTKSLDQARVPVILPLVRSVRPVEADSGGRVLELLRTTAEGWAEVDLANLDRVDLDPEDIAGPVPLAVAVDSSAASEPGGETAPDEQDSEAAQATRLVVVGDSDFASNGQLVNVGNAELVLNIVNWLTEREMMVGIPPKQTDDTRLSLSQSELRTISWLVFAVMPGAAALLGALVFWQRRR